MIVYFVRQAQNLEKENRMNIEKANSSFDSKQQSPIRSSNSNDKQKLRPNSAQEQRNHRFNSDSDTDINKNSEISLRNQNNSPQRSVSSQSNRNMEELEKKNRPRVRISSVVENIETRECFKLQTDSLNDFDDTSSDSDEKVHKPYELTRPYQNNIDSKQSQDDDNKSLNQHNVSPHKPKVTLL